MLNILRLSLFLVTLSFFMGGIAGCASSGKDGLSAMDVSERQSANYGSGNSSTEREADANNVNLLKFKNSF